jgi:hypothetical protein
MGHPENEVAKVRKAHPAASLLTARLLIDCKGQQVSATGKIDP